MRLINTTSLELKEFFNASQIPAYAILSHCWGEEEVSLKDYLDTPEEARHGPGWKKITDCCSIARDHGLDWAWVDTCCIDKSSTAELQEAINSMYRWYERAALCYAFLHDFDSSGMPPQDGDGDASMDATNSCPSSGITWSKLSDCKWFTRGWTLQELVAPSRVLFYDCKGKKFGAKTTMAQRISHITGIAPNYLLKDAETPLSAASVACRMSWASKRTTTRQEDLAYCLLGIFGINLPLIYGEGDNAFTRLQETIIESTDDQSIFAWVAEQGTNHDRPGSMLAPCPNAFRDSANIVPFRDTRPPARMTSRGLELCYPVRKVPVDRVFDAYRTTVALVSRASTFPSNRIDFPLACIAKSHYPPRTDSLHSRHCHCIRGRCSVMSSEDAFVEITLQRPPSERHYPSLGDPRTIHYYCRADSSRLVYRHREAKSPAFPWKLGLSLGLVAFAPDSARFTTVYVQRRGSGASRPAQELHVRWKELWWLARLDGIRPLLDATLTALLAAFPSGFVLTTTVGGENSAAVSADAIQFWTILALSFHFAPIKLFYLVCLISYLAVMHQVLGLGYA